MASVSKIYADFREISDGSALSGETEFDVHSVSGSGVPTSDVHNNHSAGQVMDMSNVGNSFFIWSQDTLDSADQYAEVHYFLDRYDTTSSINSAAHAIVLRSDSSDAGDIDGYGVVFTGSTGGTSPGDRNIDCKIVKYTATAETVLLTNFEIDTNRGGSNDYLREGMHRFGASIVGTTITAYYDGNEVGSTTDSSYSTGGYVGGRHDRIISDTQSQPFLAEFYAWTDNDTSSVFGGGALLQTGSSTGDVSTTEVVALDNTATDGNRLVCIAVLASAVTPTGVTDDGTGSWTLDESVAEGAQGVFVWSKESNGDEDNITVTFPSTTDAHVQVIELDGDYTYDDSDTAIDDNSPTTGTLSSDEKIGFCAVAYVGTTFNDARPIPGSRDGRPLIYNVGLEDADGADGGSIWAFDLGTATTAWAPAFEDNGNTSNAGLLAVVYKKASGSSPQTMVGNDVTIEVTAAAQSFTAGAATITGNAASIDVTAASKSFTVGTAPIIPQNLRLDTTQHGGDGYSASEVALEWDSVVGATGYDIFRDSVLIVSDHPTTSYNDTGLSGNTEYDYEVRTVFT